MTNLQIASALQALAPGAEWVLRGSDLTGLTWLDTVQARPTDDQIMAQVNQ